MSLWPIYIYWNVFFRWLITKWNEIFIVSDLMCSWAKNRRWTKYILRVRLLMSIILKPNSLNSLPIVISLLYLVWSIKNICIWRLLLMNWRNVWWFGVMVTSEQWIFANLIFIWVRRIIIWVMALWISLKNIITWISIPIICIIVSLNDLSLKSLTLTLKYICLISKNIGGISWIYVLVSLYIVSDSLILPCLCLSYMFWCVIYIGPGWIKRTGLLLLFRLLLIAFKINLFIMLGPQLFVCKFIILGIFFFTIDEFFIF